MISQKKYNRNKSKLPIVCGRGPNAIKSRSSHRFKVFVQALDPNFSLPSRKHLSTTLLEKKYSVLKKAVIRRLEAVRDIHLTIGIWSNRQMKSFLGVTYPMSGN